MARTKVRGNPKYLMCIYLFIFLATPPSMWDHRTHTLHWKHGVLTTGPPGKSCNPKSNEAIKQLEPFYTMGRWVCG